MKCLYNAFTVDVEDYFQVSAFEKTVRRSQWSNYDLRVVESTERLLELLGRHNVRGTFFILGWIARQCPQLVRKIDEAGHTIGSHSYWHRLVYEMTPDEFRTDLKMSRQVLEDLTGKTVTSYRAPSFSITRRSWWALQILAEEGFKYDSSIFPVYHDRYGVPDAQTEIHTIETEAGTLQEFPPAVYPIAKWRLPVSGGGYFRLYPYRASQHMLRQVNHNDRPFVFYVHPWEVDPNQPVVKAGSRMSQFRHRVNLKSNYAKLDRLLSDFRFTSMERVLEGAHTTQVVNSSQTT
ncbi:MAG: DUF3473 domain-containing protein [Planctomycetota bacterium]|nr:DUF3473 domain-containing protein [Planctomycetota bacterium]MDA1177234.1 DUF3473 domain-containing protein [Planctomycetota bacterium]